MGEEEQLSIVRRSHMIMHNNRNINTTNDRHSSPLRRRKVRKKSKDKYQIIESSDSNLSASSFQSELSNSSFGSNYDLQSNHNDLLDSDKTSINNHHGDNEVDNTITHIINPSFSQDNYNSRYEVNDYDESK